MSNISDIRSFKEQCSQAYPQGIAVGEFVQKIHGFFGDRIIQVIGVPVPGATVSVLEKLEEAKAAGKAVPSFNAVKIVEHIQKQLAQSDTIHLESKLTKIASEPQLATVLNKKNIVWVKGGKAESLSSIILQAKEGKGLCGLSEEILCSVEKILFIKERIDHLFQERSQEVFDSLILDVTGNLHEQFLQQMPPVSLSQIPTADDELDHLLMDVSLGMDDLEEVAQASSSSPSSSEVIAEDDEILELDDIPVPQLDEEMQLAYDQIKQSHGEKIASMAKAYAISDEKVIATPLLARFRMVDVADAIRFAIEDFSNEYEEELVTFVLKDFHLDSTKDILEQLCKKADAVIADQDEKIEYLEDLFDEENDFSIAPNAKEYIFYTKTLWPGYENEGPFALAEKGEEEGRYLDYDFIFTDEIENKMRDLAEEYAGICEHVAQLTQLQNELSASALDVINTYNTLMSKREALGEPKHLPLDDVEKAWALEYMTYFAAQNQ